MKRKKGYFSISAVSKMFSVHPQTIRLYEREGFLAPKRSEGNTRMFSEEDIDRLEEIIYLTHELGINMAGVEMILKLKKQIRKLQHDMNKAFKETESELTKQEEKTKEIIKRNVTKLTALKEDKTKTIPSQEKPKKRDNDEAQPELSGWEIEYDN